MTENSGEIQLTPEQQDSLVLDRNVAITAGAGTGKTTALTERYVTVLEANPALTPENIVTITFTRKAAAELTERVREEVYDRLAAAGSDDAYHRWRDVLDDLENGYVHTIHAFCARLLKEHAVEAPVPLGFDVLDEEGTSILQREVVTEFLERNQTDDDVVLLAQLWGPSQLRSILAGLLDDRPRSGAVLEYWRDADVDSYVACLWDVACELDADEVRATLYDDGLLTQLEQLHGRVPPDHAVSDSTGLHALEVISEIVDQLPEAAATDDETSRPYLRAVADLYALCEKKNGGLYSSSGYIVGSRDEWGDHSDVYDDLKEVLNTVIDAVEPYEDAVETTPGTLEEASAHYTLALLRVFDRVNERYVEAKAKRDALDFQDIIETTIDFLDEHDEVRARVQDQFAAVMVDEFQDTDPHQWRLVKLLAGVDSGSATNVFLVGDEKQSIYGFRGADVTTFGTARSELQSVNEALGLDDVPASESGADSPTSLELSGNFRTLDEPLSFCNELFDQLFCPEGDEHEPFEAMPQPLSMERDRIDDVDGLSGSVEYLPVPDDAEVAQALLGDEHPVTDGVQDHRIEAEARALAARLTHLFDDPPHVQDQEDGEHRPAHPDDVAILLRRRTHLDRYQRALDECAIPYTVIGGTGFHETPEIQALTNLLRVLGDPNDGVSLYGVLRSPLFGFTDDQLAPVVADADSVWDALEDTDDPQLTDAFELLREWRALSGCGTPDEDGVLPWHRVISRVIDETGYLASVSADERGKQAVVNVEKFRDQVRTWSENGINTAAGLLHRIDRQAEASAREGEAEIPGDADGVRLMTIHTAKGLEFPIVAIPDIGSKHNFGRSIDDYGYVQLVDGSGERPPLPAVAGPDPDDAFSVEKTAAHEYATRVTRPQERAEAKRLLYVACTRARDHLLLCGTHDLSTDAGAETLTVGDADDFDEAKRWRDWVQPVLLEQEGLLRDAFHYGAATGQLGETRYTVRTPPRPVSWQAETDETDPVPEITRATIPDAEPAIRISATALVQAVADHRHGTSGSNDRSSSSAPGLEPTTFGTVVHRLAELRPPQDDWQAFTDRVSAIAGDEPTQADHEAILEHATDAISFVEDLEAAVELEAAYDEYAVTARLDEHKIVGDIDRLLVTPDRYHIVDYKTNDLSSTSTSELATHYRPQLLSYALALMQHDPDREVRASLRFTDAGVAETSTWSPLDVDVVENELRSMFDSLE
ncbi:UvrD-helicase domain-containing protein [Saliphagus sp. GCM10025334]